MDPRYAAAYPELFAHHWWWRARERFLLRRIAKILPADGRRRILDVGCGDGLLLDHLGPWGAAEGVESDATTLSPSAAKRKIHLGPFDASYRPSAPFDLVLFLDVLEHLPDPVVSLTRARELLTPGGQVFISVPAFESIWTTHDDLNHHHRRYTTAMLREEASRTGLTITWARYGFLAVGMAKVLVRLKEQLVTSAPKPPALPPAPLNALARAVAEVDLAVGEVIPYPFGSSLFAVLAPRR